MLILMQHWTNGQLCDGVSLDVELVEQSAVLHRLGQRLEAVVPGKLGGRWFGCMG